MRRAALGAALAAAWVAGGWAADRFPQPVRVGDLIGRTVQQPLESQPVLGHVRDVVRFPGGEVAIVMDEGGLLARFGGVFGLGSRPVAVPLGATVLLGAAMELVGLTPAQLVLLPDYAGNGVPVGRDETVRVGLARPSH